MYTREINYEPEVEADADLVAVLFSRTLRSLPLEGAKSQQTSLRSPMRSQTQRMLLTKIHKDSNSLWGGY